MTDQELIPGTSDPDAPSVRVAYAGIRERHMPRRILTGKRAIITGASSGIGWELSLLLARRGVSVVLIARREEKLQALVERIDKLAETTSRPTDSHPWGDATIIPGDVTDPTVRASALAVAEDELDGLDILINNAGTSALGRFADASEERLRRIMEVNFFAAAELTRAAVPLLRRGRRPIVVNVGSVLSRRGVPHNCEYCASKFALAGWTEAIRPELARLGIDVLLVNPGTTDTEFFDHLIEKQGETPWPPQKGVPPEKVARAIVRAIQRDRREIVPSWKGRTLVWLNRLSPRLVDRIVRRWG